MSSEHNINNHLATAFSRAIFAVRERIELTETVSSGQFVTMLLEISVQPDTCKMMLEKVNFVEGELKADDLLARLELMRATAEEGNQLEVDHKDEAPIQNAVILVNNSYASADSTLNPWKRTISQLSLSSIFEPDLNVCRVEVTLSDITGPFYDRHRNYLISVSYLQSERVLRRYKDFEWLHQVLLHKYPFRALPTVPEKKLFVGTREDFLNSRRRGLEEFLTLIVNHPVIQKDPILLEFLSVEDFLTIRNRVYPAWEEEFSLPSTTDPQGQLVEPSSIQEPDWSVYDDAKQWTEKVTSSIEGLLKALSTLANTHSESQLQLANIASYTSLIFENTQHSEKETSFIPKALGSLGGPHARLGEETEKHGLSLELFLRLMIGCQELVTRTKKMKFNNFGYLSDQIVALQAYSEKLRVRDGPNSSPDLEKALSKISKLQQELIYHAKRNEFADSCLRDELSWVIKMMRSLPVLILGVQSTLHQYYQLLAELSKN